MFVLLSLVALSIFLGIDMLLGAFAAGVLDRLLLQGAPAHDAETTEAKIEAVGFGLLVPVFFINTGITFDLHALVSDARTLLLLPVFTLLLLVSRGIPTALLAPRGSTVRERVATGFFGATGLPIIVAVTALGVDAGDLDSGMAAALVGAGLLSVLAFPLVALAVRTGKPSAPSAGIEPATKRLEGLLLYPLSYEGRSPPRYRSRRPPGSPCARPAVGAPD